MGSSLQSFPPQQDPQKQQLVSCHQEPISRKEVVGSSSSSSSKCKAFQPHEQPRNPPIRHDLQFVAGSQPTNALAFVIDGIYYGVPNFEYAAYSMRMDVMDHEFAIHAGS